MGISRNSEFRLKKRRMHIAVCDDDIAQRKQTERLLGREADKWIARETRSISTPTEARSPFLITLCSLVPYS